MDPSYRRKMNQRIMKNTKKSQSTSEKEFDPFCLDGVEAVNDREEKKVDRPDLFNPFQDGGSSDPFPNDSTWADPWSTDPWENDPLNTSFFSALEQPPPLVDSSFDSSSSQYFAASIVGGDDNPFLNASSSPPDPFEKGAFGASDPFPTKSDVPIKLSSPREKPHKIPVMLQERLSILFDDVTSSPICRVTGFIYARPSKRKLKSFCLTVRDKKGRVERWEEQSSVCKNITAYLPHVALDPGDQVFRVDAEQLETFEGPIVAYSCVERLKPLPILLKTKVQRKEGKCRAGVRMRANPNNGYPLTQIAILMVVPPDVDGEKASMSRQGGVWNAMKRTISWTIAELSPGETVDIQAQFRCMDGAATNHKASIFPVLVRGDRDSIFSRIGVNAVYTDEGSSPVTLEVEQCSRIIYRKV